MVKVTEVAKMASELDGVKEKASKGLRGWYLHDRLVARQEDADTLLIRCDLRLREKLLAENPETFFVTPRVESHMKIFADLRRGDAAAISKAVTAAWELQRSA